MRGAAIAITSRDGEPLDLGKRQLERKHLSVLGVRKRPFNQNGDRTEANVFVTQEGFEELVKRVDKYVGWKPTDKKRPNGFWLFEGAESFRHLVIEDYWNDEESRFPQAIKDGEWEVWTRQSLDKQLHGALEKLKLRTHGKHTSFQDINIYNLVGSRRQIENLINDTGAVVELRGASNFVARDHQVPLATPKSKITSLATKLVAAGSDAPTVTLLDTGVARQHPLLQKSLPRVRCHSADPSWDAFDADGHGTNMAGVVLFGNLEEALDASDPLELPLSLESVTVSAPGHAVRLPARDALASAIDIVEATPGRRVFCLAATAIGETENGVPTSTSATLDKLAYGDGVNTRLFCAAVGNVDTAASRPYIIANYETRNADHRVQSPAQAYNALSVGAATQLCSRPDLIAPIGDLSPTSRTTIGWDAERPHKPDIVMEGGNHVPQSCGQLSQPHPDDMIMTTGRDIARRPITVTGETSAATAAASRLAALVMKRYPAMRPETVRGLIVNSARWTDAMKARMRDLQNRGLSQAQATYGVLSCYGWGIPDEERLFRSANNALTLIVEDTLQPYEVADNRIRLREMKYFKLPWPDQALEALGGTEVEVRCTLSYFAEPDPGSTSRDEPVRYQGHRLKFDFKRFGETDEQAQRRFNASVETASGAGDDTGWLLGRYKSRGTLHQDIWKGPAYQLRERNGISVAPNHGWWSEYGSEPEDKEVRFSLIVSVSTTEVSAQLYAEILANAPRNKLVVDAGVRVDV